LSLFSLSASCSGLLWFGLLAGLVGSLVLHFRGSNNSGNRKKKHLTVSLFGIHCEFKGRLSDRNNKEARSGSADVNAAAAAAAAPPPPPMPQKKIQKPQGTLLDAKEKRKGGCWLRPGGAIMGHGP